MSEPGLNLPDGRAAVCIGGAGLPNYDHPPVTALIVRFLVMLHTGTAHVTILAAYPVLLELFIENAKKFFFTYELTVHMSR